jgi:HNH endonuclease
MKTKKPNLEQVWKQLEDVLVPRLHLGPIDRATYCYLLRHSYLEGKRQLQFSIASLARGVQLSHGAARKAVRRLADHQALRLLECSHTGHTVKVRLPEEILADLPPEAVLAGQPEDTRRASPALAVNLEEADFLTTKTLRQAIHAREGGSCFYCLKRHTPSSRCIDHVVPLAQSGRNSYRNLVSCCRECNAQKGQCRADDFLRSLFRERKLTDRELAGRLRALDALAAGKLPPPLPSTTPPDRRSPAAPQRRAKAVSSTPSKTP